MNEIPRPVLLVEDNSGDALLLKEALREFNAMPPFELVHVSRLGEAIERANASRFKAILLDLSLPDAHGVDTVVRMQQAAGDVPIIVLTGLNDDSIAVEAVRAGAQDYLVKEQIDGRLLVRALSYAIERKRLQEATYRDLERITALKDLNIALTATLSLATVIEVLKEKVDRLLPDFAMAIRLWNRELSALESVASVKFDDAEWNERTARPDRPGSFAQDVFTAKKTLLIRDVANDPRTHHREFWHRHGFTAYLGLPLLVGEEILGVASFYAMEDHEFTAQEFEFLDALASQTSAAIRNSQIHEEMKKLAADLERSNRVKDEFLGVISHELRTPINVASGSVELLQSGLIGELNQEQGEALENIAQQTKIQLAMVNAMLNATTMESQVATVASDLVSLGQLIEELQSAYPSPADGKVQMEWRYSQSPIEVRTDRAKLQFILHNLINNAVKFTPAGRVTVSVDLRLPETAGVRSAPAQPSTGWLTLEVADTGMGIAAEFLPVIFDKFSQADASTTRVHEGIGLGLHIVKRCAELLNGKIAVASEVNQGSTFTVKIPCEIATGQDSMAQAPSALDLVPSLRPAEEL